MRMKSNLIFLFAVVAGMASCASNTGIFPSVVTSTSESAIVLPNPVSLAVDEARSQIIVANSNVDIFFDSGSLAVLSVDATTPTAPVLSAAQIVPAPNFAGEISFDGTSGVVTLPFRESSDTTDATDQIRQYQLSAGSLAELRSTTTSPDPFGTAANAGNLYVVCDDALDIYDATLTHAATIDLTTAQDAGISDTAATDVTYVAIDTTGNRAFIGNPGGSIFVVDLATNALTTAITGPTSTRNVIVDNATGLLYALDPLTQQVWIFNTTQLATPASTPDTEDDSTFLIATVATGVDPNGMVLDTAANRLYVANSSDNTISVIDTLTFTEIARVSVASDDLETTFGRGGDYPFALALGTFNGTRYLFAASFNNNSVVMINTATLGVVEVYPNNSL